MMEGVRADFPMLKKKMHGQPLVYLDSAATALKPLSVVDAIRDFYLSDYGTVHRAIYQLSVQATERYHRTRECVARFLGARSSSEILFTKGTTEALNLVASSFGGRFLREGDTVLVSQLAHHSNIVPWQLMGRERGVMLRVIPVNDRGELILEELETLLDGSAKLVAVSHVANAVGTVHPIREICRMAHERGAVVCVDGAQGAPHRPVDVQALDCDFYAFSGHKLYGPTGVGVLYGKARLLQEMLPYQGGGDMIETVTFEQTTYNEHPLKFEAGTPHIAGVLGLGAAVDYLQAIGLQRIHDHELKLVETALPALERIPGLRVIGTAEERGGIISFCVEGVHPLDLGTLLDLRGFALRTGHHCAQPTMQRFGVEATARISFGLYNTEEEVLRFAESLEEVVATFH